MSKKRIAIRNKKKSKNVANNHIEELIRIAKSKPNSLISKNSIELLSKYSTRHKIPIPREFKRTFCKKCHNIFNSENSTRRIKNGIQTITCKDCKEQKRIKIKD